MSVRVVYGGRETDLTVTPTLTVGDAGKQCLRRFGLEARDAGLYDLLGDDGRVLGLAERLLTVVAEQQLARRDAPMVLQLVARRDDARLAAGKFGSSDSVLGGVGVDDVAALSPLDLATVEANLRVRFEHGERFTRAGPMLLALNSFWSEPGAEAAANGAAQTVADAFYAVANHGDAQAILLVGDVGSGKGAMHAAVLAQLASLAPASPALPAFRAVTETILPALGTRGEGKKPPKQRKNKKKKKEGTRTNREADVGEFLYLNCYGGKI